MSIAMNQTYYFFLFIFILEWLAVMAASNSNITADQSALLAFRDCIITSEPQEILAKNWSVSSSVCDWTGVTCGTRHQVTALNISNMNLTGILPPQLGNLSFLVSLDISSNNFHGEMPRELAHLRRLRYLDFGINNLSGELPSWLGLLHELQFLSLINNSFSGTIPPSISNMSNLEMLGLSFNSIVGTVPIEFQNLHNLKFFTIDNNQLSGPLPLHVFNISSLEVISFMNNSLSGILPDNICQRLQKITDLNLADNKLIGRIPSTVSQCSLLRYLYLDENHFTGTIPKGIGNLTMLEELYLCTNSLTGAIPNELGNLTMLTVLNFHNNKLTGGVPENIGNLSRLEALYLENNTLSGSIPAGIFNISSLQYIELNQNKFSGTIPLTMSNRLSNLMCLNIYENYLSGVIPSFISNASKLVDLSLHSNELTGSIPNSIESLRNLEALNLAFNRLSSESSSPELSFFSFLTTCRFLRYLQVDQNPLNGFLPASFSNYSTSIKVLSASSCKIKGNIPIGITNLSNLLNLDFSGNELIGSVPRTIHRLTNLQELSMGFNQIRDVLDVFCELHSLGLLQLSHNQFFGNIPECLGNMTNLRQIFLDSNKLTSTIPANLLSMKDLQVLNISSNFLSGSLEIGSLKAVYCLDFSINQLSDEIPTTIGELISLQNLSLAKNNFQGSIPESISNMIILEFLDLSHNNFSGVIPKSLEELKSLKEFNVSFNRLSGEVPQGGPFETFTSQSFMYNEALCGDPRLSVPPCQSNSTRRSSKRKVLLLVISLSGIATITIVVIVRILILIWLKKPKVSGGAELMSVEKYSRFSYYDLLHSTDNYSESNLLGEGSFGSVYKGNLSDGIAVAIKVFNLQVEGALKSFDVECEVLKSLRHRNLTKVLGSCSNPDFKALVLKYMPNGNLEKWLYSQNYFLDLIQRVNIMIDVACALEYLHCGYDTPVVHCDLKPSNILLDENMIAHVSDFGIAKMFGERESILHTSTLATLGYIAPEYGSEGIVSTRIDVYSFGIVLMETFSKMKPSDEMFSGDLSLKSWVEDSLPDALQVIDANLIRPEDEDFTDKLKCVTLIMKLALNCCRESPEERINMKDALAELKKIMHQLLMTVALRS